MHTLPEKCPNTDQKKIHFWTVFTQFYLLSAFYVMEILAFSGFTAVIILQNVESICKILSVILNFARTEVVREQNFHETKSSKVIFSADQLTAEDYTESSKKSKMRLLAEIFKG